MEIEYKGANTLTIKHGANANIVINPKLSVYGLKDLKVSDAIELVHEEEFALEGGQKILIKGPGEYEVSGVSITAISTKKINDPNSKVTIFRLDIDGVRIAVIGNINPKLDETQLEAIGVIDILAIPVGGNNVTLNFHDAAKLANHIDPKMIIPMHYADKSIKYDVEQDSTDGFYKELGANDHETVEKLKIKNGSVPAIRTVVEIKRS